MALEKEYRLFIWKSALNYLAVRADMEMVRQHMSLPDVSGPEHFSDVYLRFLKSLANRQEMPKIIGEVERLAPVFCDFDHQRTLQRYRTSWEAMFDVIRETIRPSARMDKDNPHSYWVIFCKGSISGARYLARFHDLEQFLQFIRDFDEKPSTRPALPLLIGYEIFGYGFSLACDFLKELGFSNYSKPDRHLIDIFYGLGISSKSPLDVFRTVSLMACEVGETPFAVDKAFWLIGSGNLYLHNVKFKTNKREFIQTVKSNWQVQVLGCT